MNITVYVVPFLPLGLVAGILGGVFSMGGCILLAPVPAFVFGLTQHKAQGTTLALMAPPIGLLGAWTYCTQGYIDGKIAVLICLGSSSAACSAPGAPAPSTPYCFDIALLITALKMILTR